LLEGKIPRKAINFERATENLKDDWLLDDGFFSGLESYKKGLRSECGRKERFLHPQKQRCMKIL
jgi:hypothetical protein